MYPTRFIRPVKFAGFPTGQRRPANYTQRRHAATSSSDPSQSNPSKNTILLVAGAAAAAGAYYYVRTGPGEDVSAKAKRDEEIMIQKARESLEAGKSRVIDARKQAEQKLDETKVGEDKVLAGKVRLKSAEETMEQTMQDAESRLKELGAEAKVTAGDALARARGSKEKLYDETRSAIERKGDEAKRGWFGWLGRGKSKAEDVKREKGS